MDKYAKASPPWPRDITSLYRLYVNRRVSWCDRVFGLSFNPTGDRRSLNRLVASERSDGLNPH
jgi:hypothetical protein